MRLILALVLPWASFFTIGRPVAGAVCLLLQLSVFGWLPAALWAMHALGTYQASKTRGTN